MCKNTSFGLDLLGLAGASSDLREQKINAKRSVLVVQVALELLHLVSEHVRGISDTANHTQSTSVGDSRGKPGAGGNVHAGEEHGVLDLQEIRERSAELLWTGSSSR